MTAKRDQALALADELLADIELGRLEPIFIARKASRLARLLDDFKAMKWLSYEVTGYESGTTGSGITKNAWNAAERSGRTITYSRGPEKGGKGALTQSLASLDAEIQAALVQCSVAAENSTVGERQGVRRYIAQLTNVRDNVVGSIHQWAQTWHYDLRFGAAAETSFSVVRSFVDSQVSRVVPDAAMTLSAAFENASSSNPEQWANAAAACRRLIKSLADALRPPGPAVGGRNMGEENYVNRLVDWIADSSPGETQWRVLESDLEHLGKRLHAFTNAGNKGAHNTVTQFEASRYVAGTYLLLGDILSIGADSGDNALEEPLQTQTMRPAAATEANHSSPTEPVVPAQPGVNDT